MSVLQDFFSLITEFNEMGALVQSRWDNGPWGPGMMGWGMMGWAGGIMMIIFWIVIIVAVVIFIRWMISTERQRHPFLEQKESAIDILKKRYARGEINKEEFEQKKQDLS